MKDKLIHFLNNYGFDFFHKLNKYQTASYRGKYVKLLCFYEHDLTFLCSYEDFSYPHSRVQNKIDLFDLDEFCL